MPILKTLNQNFFKTWTPEMAYVLGFFAADGCMFTHSSGGKYIELTSCDRSILEKIRRLLNSDHKISSRKRSKDWSESYRIQIGSKEIWNDLLRLGMVSAKSLVLKFPEVPRTYLKDFVRGYFDGDGCVYFRKNWAKDRNKERWVL